MMVSKIKRLFNKAINNSDKFENSKSALLEKISYFYDDYELEKYSYSEYESLQLHV
ncbi:hypothetical protein [Piscirickettsia litoralis]|uniref:hypothetical protein n=1 Tax=Piscirickettsia litoralis TaxID=1891921 RepID=UPI00130132BC|nr:hypothetical protein [Piscirickettsia litoralis]